MSQGDYLKYKKTSVELRINKLDSILNNSDYIKYKEYALENKIISSQKLTYNKLLPSNTKIVFDMEKKNTGNCPGFIYC